VSLTKEPMLGRLAGSYRLASYIQNITYPGDHTEQYRFFSPVMDSEKS